MEGAIPRTVIRTFNEGRDLKAVGYVRVSTEEQAHEGYSLEAQERSIRAYCEARGWSLTRVYRDEGLSAYKDVRRPGYEAMIAAMGNWDVVVVWKLNRLHRTMRGFVMDSLKLADAKKDLASVTESLDTSSAMGKLVYHLLGALGQFESDQTSERVKAAFAEKFESDTSAWFTRAPLGYDLINGKLVKNDREAEIVRGIFEAVHAGRNSKAIASRLETDGTHGKQGGDIAQVGVLQIVHNPVYAGYVYYNGRLRRNGHEAIVSDEEFNRAQIALYVRTSKHGRYPVLLGAPEIDARRMATSGKGAAVYIPKKRPSQLDELVAAEMLRGRGRVRARRAKSAR